MNRAAGRVQSRARDSRNSLPKNVHSSVYVRFVIWHSDETASWESRYVIPMAHCLYSVVYNSESGSARVIKKNDS